MSCGRLAGRTSPRGELRYPNESAEYRETRYQLLKDEQELIAEVKAVAAKRRTLPPGGALKEDCVFQADYRGRASDDMQPPLRHVFRREGGQISHFWGTETMNNHVDAVWVYWNMMDFSPEGRPDIQTPPQNFRSEFLEKHCLSK